MLIVNKQLVMFDPVKEHKAIKHFEENNPDWEKSECSVCVSFTKTTQWSTTGMEVDDGTD